MYELIITGGPRDGQVIEVFTGREQYAIDRANELWQELDAAGELDPVCGGVMIIDRDTGKEVWW